MNLLTAQNEKEANNLSENIEKLNFERRKLSQMLWDKIQTEIEKQNSESLIKVDCTGYPLGLLGPFAGRLVENLGATGNNLNNLELYNTQLIELVASYNDITNIDPKNPFPTNVSNEYASQIWTYDTSSANDSSMSTEPFSSF